MRCHVATLLASLLATAMPGAPLADSAVRDAVVRLATDIGAGADRHDWERVRAAMADTIVTDYTIYFGGEPTTQPADELVKGWAAFLPGFDSTHHMVTNHAVRRVDGDTAHAESDFIATHRLGDTLWTLGGRYEYTLKRRHGAWKIAALTMNALWESGDPSLVQRAAQRASEDR